MHSYVCVCACESVCEYISVHDHNQQQYLWECAGTHALTLCYSSCSPGLSVSSQIARTLFCKLGEGLYSGHVLFRPPLASFISKEASLGEFQLARPVKGTTQGRLHQSVVAFK